MRAMETLAASRFETPIGALRVVCSWAAMAGTCGSCSVHTTRLSAGSRERVMPSLTMRASHRMGAPASSAARAASAAPAEKRMWAARATMPAAWTMRTATISSVGEKRCRSASARMMANEAR